MVISMRPVICRLGSGKASIGHICNKIQRTPRKIRIRFMLKRRKYQKKTNIKTEVNKSNDKELEQEIKTGRKTQMMHDYNKKI